ncbi:MAG: putative metalloprotease CJM1_0395 family protein [Pseudomonadota bacterium]
MVHSLGRELNGALMLSLATSANLPGLGLDRSLPGRAEAKPPAPVPGPGGPPPDLAREQRVGGAQGQTEPGQTLPGSVGSGLGDGARANLLQAADGAEAPGPNGLTEAEEAQVRELRARDLEVRRHEEAHARVGGQYAGQPSYTFQVGPDGKRYAIGGEVPIDVAPVPDDPEATIRKMEVVIAAALAPAEPSGQDRKVAALASRQRIEATVELAAERLAAQQGDAESGEPSIAGASQAIDAAGRSPVFERTA